MSRKQLIDINRRYWPVWVITSVALGLVISSFIVPPTGVVDPSVLAAMGELLGFSALITFIIRAEAGDDITFQKGDMKVKLDTKENINSND